MQNGGFSTFGAGFHNFARLTQLPKIMETCLKSANTTILHTTLRRRSIYCLVDGNDRVFFDLSEETKYPFWLTSGK